MLFPSFHPTPTVTATPSPITSGWLFNYVNTLRSTDVPAADGVLEMPDGVKVMNVEDLGCRMFIRPCYPKLWDNIVNVIETGVIFRFIVMGIPGIGKTTFLYYLLHVLVKRSKCVVFEDFKGLMFMVQLDGTIYRGKRGDSVFEEPLANTSTYYLFNCGGSTGTTTPLLESVSAVTIVASSPSEDHTKELSKTNHNVYYMPMWKLGELQLCRNICVSPLTEAVVADRFAKWGGVARQALFTGDDEALSNQLETALVCFRDNPLLVLCGVGSSDSKVVSHKLLHYQVDEIAFKKYSTTLASDYIGGRMCDMNLQGVVDRIAVLQTDKEEHTLRGRLFEPFAHRILQLGSKAFGEKPLRMLSLDNDKYVTIPDITSSVAIRSIIDIDPYSNTNGIYLKPEVPNFPVVDSLVTPRTGYQVTVSSKHDIKVAPFKELLDKLCCTDKLKFRLVWVVPPDVDFKCPKIADSSIIIRVEQFILKLPLFLPPSLKQIAVLRPHFGVTDGGSDVKDEEGDGNGAYKGEDTELTANMWSLGMQGDTADDAAAASANTGGDGVGCRTVNRTSNTL